MIQQLLKNQIQNILNLTSNLYIINKTYVNGGIV